MPVNNIDWDDLRYFLAAAESGSLSAAAKRLDSNQPTVGRHIDSLEAALGIKLFQRHAQGLSLTDEGQLVLVYSQNMEQGISGIHRLLSTTEETARGRVRIALPEGLCVEVLVPRLNVFYRRHPGIQLELNVSPRSANLLRCEADIALRLYRPDQADLVVKKLATMHMGLYASQPYIDARGKPDTLEQLRDHDFIAYGDELADLAENRWLLENTYESRGVLYSNSTSTRLQATRLGLGLSVQPELFAAADTTLVQLLVEEPVPHHDVWLVYHHDLRATQRVRVVADFLIDLFNGSDSQSLNSV